MEFYILPGTKVRTKHKTFTRIKDSDRILLTDLFYTYEESEVEEVSYPEDQEYCIADNKVLVPKKWVRGKEFHCLKSPARMFIDDLDEEARNYVGEHLDKSDSGEPILFFDKDESNKISKFSLTPFENLFKEGLRNFKNSRSSVWAGYFRVKVLKKFLQVSNVYSVSCSESGSASERRTKSVYENIFVF